MKTTPLTPINDGRTFPLTRNSNMIYSTHERMFMLQNGCRDTAGKSMVVCNALQIWANAQRSKAERKESSNSRRVSSNGSKSIPMSNMLTEFELEVKGRNFNSSNSTARQGWGNEDSLFILQYPSRIIQRGLILRCRQEQEDVPTLHCRIAHASVLHRPKFKVEGREQLLPQLQN